ncbi:MAG TPA: hypothetical protein VIM29_13395 [Bacillota bacterium]
MAAIPFDLVPGVDYTLTLVFGGTVTGTFIRVEDGALVFNVGGVQTQFNPDLIVSVALA